MKKFLYIAAMTLLLASCTEDFKDWADPQSNPQGELVTFGTGSVASVGVIDLAEIPEGEETVKVCDITAPASNDESYTPEYLIYLNDKPFVLGLDGTMNVQELSDYVVSLFGQAPEVRELTARVKSTMTNGTTATSIMSDEFTVKVIPATPKISTAYYYVGTSNGWAPCDPTYQLTNGGGDVYTNPVFTVVVPATGEDNWFKIYSQETMDLGTDGFWNGDFIGYAVNGENELTGNFVEGANDQIAYAFKIPADIRADKYRLSFDMLNRTFEIEPIIELGTPDLWYLVGSCIGNGSWGNAADALGTALVPLYPAIDNYSILNYVGYFPAGQGFKLIHTPGNWDEQWGMTDGVLVKNDGGSSNIEVPEDGYYQITYDMEMDVLTITNYPGPVGIYSMMGMPGGYQGWNPAGTLMDPMSSVVENHDWVLKNATYGEDTELKFAADGAWTINWGGAGFPVGIGENKGPNIPVVAGTYDVIFNDLLGEYYFIAK
ncbi:MAG: DUF5115 domain-containing protein [Muribaculaceae bacterium]|nr:DUF5115 domain-containing protein [Muribaculaceae bacterium]